LISVLASVIYSNFKDDSICSTVLIKVPPDWTKSSITNKLIKPSIKNLLPPTSFSILFKPDSILIKRRSPFLSLLQVIVLVSLFNNFANLFLAPSSGNTIIFKFLISDDSEDCPALLLP